MRDAFAHEATLTMSADGDVRAPGGAITVELCGSWEHEPPCPLAPHHTRAEQVGDEIRLRILFATEPDNQAEVRKRIDVALARGQQQGPDGAVTFWQVRRTGPSPIAISEIEHAQRLANTHE